ncbi:MAG TPA: hypothetical protein VFV73_42730 [Streptosporangiaceae bacterium]|nr:hypothetical protein [Streptosporangiaceae bacterium]
MLAATMIGHTEIPEDAGLSRRLAAYIAAGGRDRTWAEAHSTACPAAGADRVIVSQRAELADLIISG